MSTLNLDWSSLPFGYLKTNCYVKSVWKDGSWSPIEVVESEYINMHIAATAIHYGQQAFEGLKVYRGKDDKIRLFRWQENAKRLRNSAIGIKMAEVPDELFREAVDIVVKKNIEFLPPYGTGASLYLRPLLYGSGAEVGVKPAAEYTFFIFVSPVGPYFKSGFSPVDIAIVRDSDRAAPLGTGMLKVGGNYAASLKGLEKAKKAGCSSPLYLDAKEKRYIDEIGAANFFGIKNNTYITPESKSILPSITNMSLTALVQDLGLKVERRPVDVDELASFEEVGACGTAAIISPIGKIVDMENDKIYNYCKDGKPGPISTKIYERLQSIQYGEIEDKYGWIDYIKL